jgi:ribosomal protein S18 acetylase RimI-like enzyme
MIKRLTIKDIKPLEEMIKEGGSTIESLENIEGFLSNNQNYLLAYMDGEKIVGILLAYTLQRYDGRNEMLYLHEIDVLESHRKRGIGSKLMAGIKHIKEENNFDKIFLITNKSNQAAMALYQSCGGQASGDDDIIFHFK